LPFLKTKKKKRIGKSTSYDMVTDHTVSGKSILLLNYPITIPYGGFKMSLFYIIAISSLKARISIFQIITENWNNRKDLQAPVEMH